MKGDFTRLTFNPAKHYVAVRAQQGRVSVDADVNELQDIADHLRTTALADIIGPVGAPADGGLGLLVTGAGAGVAVNPGRLYVDGVLVEVDAPASLALQPHLPPDAAVVRRSDGTWVPFGAAPAGRYLAYVDAWRHHVTAIDDPLIREVALGGPDTATREQLLWQVRLLRVGDTGSSFGCADPHAAWDAATAVPNGVLAARAEPDDPAAGPCIVPADAGFRRIDNQLYRVEVHDGGPTGTATWKVSRENGAVERRLVGILGDDLLVSRPGRDAADGFPSGSWVEITDDNHVLTGRPGTLVRVVRADGDAIGIDPATATGSLLAADFPDTPRVRRWDTDGARRIELGPGDGFLDLEDGVQVRFSSAGTWRTGDYWTIPARVATGDIEWPDVGGAPAAVAPHGVRHHHARLAVLTHSAAGAWTLESNCHPVFPPLTRLRTLRHVAGDGQEARPDSSAPNVVVPLGQPLVVGVSTGSMPVAGARVRFAVTVGAGVLNAGAPGASVEVATDAAGLASVQWSVDETTPSQQVTARLLEPNGDPDHLPFVFGAELATAARTAYDPAGCAPLTGAVTVQQAIDRLCGLSGGGCGTLTLSPGDGWQDALAALPKGQDAVVCFRPGQYVTDRVVEMVGLGHLVLHGGGAASVVHGLKIERVLEVRGAASLHLHDLDVRAGAVGETADGHEHIGGAVTVVDTPVVAVERLRARSMAGARRQAACLAVRGTPDSPVSVRVTDCDLTVGHHQVGMLLVDCDVAEVTGNRVSVMRKPRRLGILALLADPDTRRRVVQRLAGGLGETVAAPPGANTVVDAGGWRLAFNSPVPMQEWRALTREVPPTAAERVSAKTIIRYTERLVQAVLDHPDRLATFAIAVRGLERGLGPEDFASLDRGVVLRRLLVADEVAATSLAPGAGSVQVDVAGTPVAFRSELDHATWRDALAADERAARGVDPAERIRLVADRLLTDTPFRRAFPAAVNWFAALADRNPAVVGQGIVVGGQIARTVEIRGNVVDDAMVGLQVGVSHRGGVTEKADMAGRVHIVDNTVTLRLPVERERGQYGVLLGNVEHGTVAGNDVRAAAHPITTNLYDEGIRVWGHLGSFLAVRENVLVNTRTGVRVEPVAAGDQRRQWFVVDNATPHAAQSVVAPASVRRRDNLS